MRLKPVQLLTVYLPVLLLDFGFSSVLTNTSFFSSYLGLSSTFLGVLMAVTTGFFTVLAIPCGRLSDRVERRYILYAGCLVFGGASVGLAFCRSGGHLMGVFPWVGVSMALFWPTYEAWLGEREGEGDLLQRVMLFNLFWSIGMTLGPAFASYLYGETNPVRPFYLAGVSAILTLVAIWASRFAKLEPIRQEDAADSEGVEVLFPSPPVRKMYLHVARCANFASWFALGVVRRLTPKLSLEMGMRPAVYGNLMLTLGSVQTVTFLVLGTGYSTRWHYRLVPFLVVQLVMLLCFLGIGFSGHIVLWVFAFGAIGVSVAFTYFSSLYYGLDRHVDKGNKSGWHEAILGGGILLGPFLGGISADSPLGVQSPYLLCAVAVAVVMVIEGFIFIFSSRGAGGVR